MSFAVANGVRIAYDDFGPRSDEALLCLPGWCVNRGFFQPLADELRERRQIVTFDWRGHGASDRPDGEFGHAELLADALAVIAAAELPRVVPVAQAHGGWVALELRRRLGARVPKIVALSWLVVEPPPPFLAMLQALQDAARWQEARARLLTMWTSGAPPEVAERVQREMGAYGFETWSRAAKAISADYRRHGSPLRAAAALPSPAPLLHLFSQPRAPEFLAAQEAFARAHAWLSVTRLDDASHFPPLESPAATASAIERFLT